MAWLLLTVITIGVRAQSSSAVPERPKLGAGADTNDAKAYYVWGVARIGGDPQSAAAAFFWASRIDPSNAEAFYGRWTALQLSEPHRMALDAKGDAGTRRSKDVRTIDSLYLRALTLNPFVERIFASLTLPPDPRAGTTTTRERLGPIMPGSVDSVRIGDPMARGMEISDAERSAAGAARPPAVKAVAAYSAGLLPEALKQWAAALSASKERSLVLAERGRIFFVVAGYDSATTQFLQAVAAWRPESKDYIPLVYDSRALYEYSAGMIAERRGSADSARAAYARALQIEPTFAAAHLRLSALALAKGDTLAALSELDSASRAQPADGLIAYRYGSALVRAGHDTEAVEQLKHAIALEPCYAAPRALLALIYDAADMKQEAAAAYRSYLSIASEHDPLVARAIQRMGVLGAPPPAPAKP